MIEFLKQISLATTDDFSELTVGDATQIKVPLKKFLGNSKTKDQLTVYLASKIPNHYADSRKIRVVSTKNGAESNHGDVNNLLSTQKKKLT